ncbi:MULTISPECIES: YibE/F family protein [Shouchella]|uniref:Membrane protein n=3 Tax=Bacillaceae TaxID=186817 RepID=A0A060LXH8_9BACI|nr:MULTISPECIES: YibE/F family protein [Bacillaceae]RQW22584.1 YibE/F family protein [Bacillus sp. C1-1]AIC92983.1 membrane protein [Shouchella lehensis G1]KQL56257.1 YibE/F [Alkalicoccobacillus plakortidis]MBG9783218.1 YibE/F [Shouchella lehensis]TES49408.1 YibE/F family protein [Shouchella lehensis]
MNVLTVLTVLLFILMLVVGGKKGARSFAVLFLNFIILFGGIVFMTNPEAQPLVITFVACTLIAAATLFIINEWSSKSITAFVSTMLTIAVLLVFISFVTNHTMIQGFGEEEIEELGSFSILIGLDFTQIAASVIVMSTIGAIADTAISITSPMQELYKQHRDANVKRLFLFGMKIGRDILGTNANTLFFAFFGGQLALLIWFKDLSYTLGEMVNAKVFANELITIFCAGIGVALIIPITAILSALHLVHESRKKDRNP